MEVLGFINAFDELADADVRLGRKVANQGMVEALLEHSSCDELHFFLPFFGAVRPFQEGYGRWLEKARSRRRVMLLPALSLPGMVERTSYLAMHAAELDRYFPELCHLRNGWAREPFPVTCTPHTLCYWSTQVRNLYKTLPGAREYDSFFCTSRAAQTHLQRSLESAATRLRSLGLGAAGYGGRLDIAPLGVWAEDLGGVAQEEALKALGLKPGPLTLICIGRLTPRDKADLSPLLPVLAEINQRHPLRLILAGAQEQGYGDQLVEEAERWGLNGRVLLYNDFESSLKARLLAAADVFISLADNLQETFGLALLEAMASGLPVVASDFSGYRDLVEEGVTGFLIPTCGPADFGPLDPVWPLLAEHVAALQVAQRTAVDLDALAERLEALASSPELRRRMGEAGRRRVLALFDWPVVVRRMEALWRELKARALARGCEPAPVNVLGEGLGNSYGHFPGRTLGPGSVLRAGRLAGRFLAGEWAREPLIDLAQAFTPQGLELVLEAIAARGGRAGLGEICRDLTGRFMPYQVEHMALWGLKYGLLALA